MNGVTTTSPEKPVKVLLITPPSRPPAQPYSATPYLAGFLRSNGIEVAQEDASLALLLRLFSKSGLERVAEALSSAASPANAVVPVANQYQRAFLADPSPHIHMIESVVRFAQGKDRTFAWHILRGEPPFDGSFFPIPKDLDQLYGPLSSQDKAGHIVGSYLSRLLGLVLAGVDNCYDPAVSAKYDNFRVGELLADLDHPPTVVEELLSEIVHEYLTRHDPGLVGLTIPFPSEVLGAFKIAKIIRQHSRDIAIAIGGGTVNAKLRKNMDPRLFDLVDFISMDNGETPLLYIVEHLQGTRSKHELRRTRIREGDGVTFVGGEDKDDLKNVRTACPDFSDFTPSDYLPCLYPITSLMQKLSADGPWLPIFMAHGCYWSRCEFCTIALPMIGCYAPLPVDQLIETVEKSIADTGITGFFFTDSAMPADVIRSFCEQVIERNLHISWFGNIKSGPEFTPELFSLMSRAGCVWLMSGVETFSNRQLRLIKKGTSQRRLIRLAHDLARAGIRFHAYLIVGLPTQTLQEAIDDLEIARQLLQRGYLANAQLSKFLLVAYSGYDPEGELDGAYDPAVSGAYARGGHYESSVSSSSPVEPCAFDNLEGVFQQMRRALSYFSFGSGFDRPLQDWFDFPIPRPSIGPNHVDSIINETPMQRRLAGLRVID
jgi:radical SAM superfamily enzyme YgiQ (UPF0313 family)